MFPGSALKSDNTTSVVKVTISRKKKRRKKVFLFFFFVSAPLGVWEGGGGGGGFGKGWVGWSGSEEGIMLRMSILKTMLLIPKETVYYSTSWRLT